MIFLYHLVLLLEYCYDALSPLYKLGNLTENVLIQFDFNEMHICQEFGHAFEAALKARYLGELNFKAAKASSNAVWIIIDRHFLRAPQGREL
jgi:hypothetical protein